MDKQKSLAVFLAEDTEPSLSKLPLGIASFPKEAATNARRFYSHTPGDWAKADEHDYHARLLNLQSQLLSLAKSKEQQQLVPEIIVELSKEYVKRILPWYEAESKTASMNVVGPAKFPTRRNEAAQQVASKRKGEFNLWYENAIDAAKEKLRGEWSEWQSYQHEIDKEIESVRTAEAKGYTLPTMTHRERSTQAVLTRWKWLKKNNPDLAAQFQAYLLAHSGDLDFEMLQKAFGVKAPAAKPAKQQTVAGEPASTPKTETLGKVKIEWKNAYGDSTSANRQLRGYVPGFVLIIRRTFKNSGFALVRQDAERHNIGGAIVEKEGFKTFLDAKKAGVAELKVFWDKEKPKKLDIKVPKIPTTDPHSMTSKAIDKEYAALSDVHKKLIRYEVDQGWADKLSSADINRIYAAEPSVIARKAISARLNKLFIVGIDRFQRVNGQGKRYEPGVTPTPEISKAKKMPAGSAAKLRSGAVALDIGKQDFNGVKMTMAQYNAFKKMAVTMDVPVIVAAHKGVLVHMNHEPEPPTDYAVIYPIGRFAPGNSAADAAGFLPSLADEYRGQSVAVKQAHYSPPSAPGYSVVHDEERSRWLTNRYDPEIRNPHFDSKLEASLYDAARLLGTRLRSPDAYIDSNFRLKTLATSTDFKSMSKDKPTHFWLVHSLGLDSLGLDSFAVYEYSNTKHIPVADVLKAKGLGYELDPQRVKDPMIFDLETGEKLGRMNAEVAAKFAQTYVRRPRMDGKSFSLTPVQWKAIHDGVAHAQSTDPKRVMLNGIVLRPGRRGADEIEAVATNGTIMSIVHVSGNPLPHSIYLPIAAVKAINGAYRAKQVPVLDYSHEGSSQLVHNTTSFTGTLGVTIGGHKLSFQTHTTFPEGYETLKPKRNDSSVVTINRKKLIEGLKTFSKLKKYAVSEWKFSSSGALHVRYAPWDGDRQLLSEFDLSSTVGHWNTNSPEIVVGLNMTNVLNVLKGMSSATVAFFISLDNHNPIMITDAAHHEHVLMPMRI